MKRRFVFFTLCVLFLRVLLPDPSASAAENCYYLLTEYSGECGDGGASTTSGGAFPSFSDAFNLNPASLPTFKTPFGAEAIISRTQGHSKTEVNFSATKGFKGGGIAAATNNDETFFSNNRLEAYDGITGQTILNSVSRQSATGQSAVFGGALGIPLGKKMEKITKPALGVSFRYNRLTGNIDPVFGVSINSQVASFGYSQFTENPGKGIPTATTQIFDFGVKIPHLHVEYTLTKYSTQGYSTTANTFTASTVFGRFMGTLALKTFDNILKQSVAKYLVGAEFRFSSTLTLTYLYDYLPSVSSLGMQLFL